MFVFGGLRRPITYIYKYPYLENSKTTAQPPVQHKKQTPPLSYSRNRATVQPYQSRRLYLLPVGIAGAASREPRAASLSPES